MLYLAAIESRTLGLLKSLMAKEYVQPYVLVGGTALALQLGHRKSIDIDLFTTSDADVEVLFESLTNDFEFIEKVKTKGSLIGDIDAIKVDFIRFKYQFQYPLIEEEGIRLLDMRDIAPMKIDAIAGRGSKKDFYDLYFLMEIYSLEQILEWYTEKYQHATLFHVIKSLAWFADADPQVSPALLGTNISWDKIKKRIEQEVVKL